MVCLGCLLLLRLIRVGIMVEFTIFITANKTLMRLCAKVTTVALCRLPSCRFMFVELSGTLVGSDHCRRRLPQGVFSFLLPARFSEVVMIVVPDWLIWRDSPVEDARCPEIGKSDIRPTVIRICAAVFSSIPRIDGRICVCEISSRSLRSFVLIAC